MPVKKKTTKKAAKKKPAIEEAKPSVLGKLTQSLGMPKAAAKNLEANLNNDEKSKIQKAKQSHQIRLIVDSAVERLREQKGDVETGTESDTKE